MRRQRRRDLWDRALRRATELLLPLLLRLPRAVELHRAVGLLLDGVGPLPLLLLLLTGSNGAGCWLCHGARCPL